MEKRRSQRELAQALLRERGILRLVELRETGVTAATASRMEWAGEVIRLSRGIYHYPTRSWTRTTVWQKPPSGCQKGSPASSRPWRFTI